LVGIDIEKKIKELLEQDRLEKDQSKKKENTSLQVPSLNKEQSLITPVRDNKSSTLLDSMPTQSTLCTDTKPFGEKRPEI